MLIYDLRKARRSMGLTQQQLADPIGVSLQAIKRLEQGIGSVATLMAVMNALAFRMAGNRLNQFA